MWALFGGRNSVAELLLSEPSLDVNYSDSALRMANRDVTGLRLLLADPRLASIIARCCRGRTPLVLAVFHGSVVVFWELVRVNGVEMETSDISCIFNIV